MASIGEVQANSVNQSSRNETEDRPYIIYFGVFFDGTGNNMIQSSKAKSLDKKLKKLEDNPDADNLLDAHKTNLELSSNGANSIEEKLVEEEDSDFSNIAALHSDYRGLSDKQRSEKEDKYNVRVFNIYIQGAGTNEVWISNWEGLGFGTGRSGVAALVGKAMSLIDTVIKGLTMKTELDNEVVFDVFGFSRGATCARMFSHYVNGDLDLTKGYPNLFTLKKTYLSQFKKKNRKVAFLGIYDTVSSIGITYDNNNKDYGLYSPNEDWVEHTCHICALDEFRDHFRLTDVGNAVNSRALEIYLPGCHSDIGGGYKKGTETMRIRYAYAVTPGKPDSPNGSSCNRDSRSTLFKDIRELSTNDMGGVQKKDNVLGLKEFRTKREPEPVPINMYQSINANTPGAISIEWLGELGWYARDIKGYSFWTDTFNRILNITRPLERGYSNITLCVMKDKAMELTERDMFGQNESRFTIITADLNTFNNTIKNKIGNNVSSGKHIIIPANEDYRTIRAKYLHFSANDSLVMAWKKTSIVNSPTVENCTLNRIVYVGNIGATSKYFMYPQQ